MMDDWKPQWMPNHIRVFEEVSHSAGAHVTPLQSIRYVDMEFIQYSSWNHVRGFFCVERRLIPTDRKIRPEVTHFFFGYECMTCKDVILIPDTVKSDYDLYKVLQHKCAERGANAQTSSVREISRPS